MGAGDDESGHSEQRPHPFHLHRTDSGCVLYWQYVLHDDGDAHSEQPLHPSHLHRTVR